MTGSSEARERGVDFQHTLHALRCAGWTVAVHNDYRLSGEPKTFWLLTHPNGHYVKGEGATDMDALMQCDAAVRALSAPSPCAGEKEGWRPIETAPKDAETYVVLWCPEDKSRWIASWQHKQWYGVDDCGLTRASHSGPWGDLKKPYEITCWQPLPLPPGAAPSPPRQGVEREKLREAAARAVCAVRKVNPDAMHQNYSDDEPVDGYFNQYSFHGGDRQVPAHKGWRNHLDVVDAVLALLQPEGDHAPS